jgi:hypothetical protein
MTRLNKSPAGEKAGMMQRSSSAGFAGATPSFLEIEALEVRPEEVRQIGPREGELHRGLEKAQLLARVVALALELDRVDAAPAPQGAEENGSASGRRRRPGPTRDGHQSLQFAQEVAAGQGALEQPEGAADP